MFAEWYLKEEMGVPLIIEYTTLDQDSLEGVVRAQFYESFAKCTGYNETNNNVL